MAPVGFAHRLGLSVLRLHLVGEVSVALDCATVDRPLSQYKGIASRVTATDLFRWSRDGEVRSQECRVVAHGVRQVFGLLGPRAWAAAQMGRGAPDGSAFGAACGGVRLLCPEVAGPRASASRVATGSSSFTSSIPTCSEGG